MSDFTAKMHKIVCRLRLCSGPHVYRVFQKNGPLVYFDDNFGKYGPILTIFSLLQQEIYEAQKLSYFSHLTFIMLPFYLAEGWANEKNFLALCAEFCQTFVWQNSAQSAKKFFFVCPPWPETLPAPLVITI